MPLDAPSRELRSVEWLFIGLILIWLLWGTLHALLPGDSRTFFPYIVAPLLILAGAVVGRGTRWAWQESASPARWGILAVLILVGLGALWVDLYANAQAAVGLQLVAIAALALATRVRTEGGLSSNIGIGVVVLLVIGVLLAA